MLISLSILLFVIRFSNFLTVFLDWAALNGRVEIVELLLAHKADPNLKNEFDHIPFEEAL